MHLRPQIVCYELKGDLSPVVLKKNHTSMTGWLKLIIIIIIKTYIAQLSMGHDQMRFTIS